RPTVTVDARALADGRSGAGDLDHVGAVDAAVAHRLSCDASLMRVVMAGPSQPLDVGRRTPVVPPAIRRAVIVRDRRCRFPGCDRPSPWCDAHSGLNRSLQHLRQDEPTAQGGEREGSKTAAWGERGRLAEEEGPAPGDDP